MVGGNAVTGVEVDVGKAQRKTSVLIQAVGLGIRAVAKIDALSLDVQRAVPGARTAAGHGPGRLSGAVPDQVGRADGRHVARIPQAVDGRGRDHQILQPAAPGLRIQSVQRDAAVEVERVASGQAERFQGWRSKLSIAAQQPVQHALIQRQAGRQATDRRQCFSGTDVDRTHSQCQVTGAETHRFGQFELIVGGRRNAAIRIKHRRIGACLAIAGTDADAARRSADVDLWRQHIRPPVGHHQQTRGAGLIDETARGVVRHLAASQRVDAGTGLDRDGTVPTVGPEQHFGC
ncbi:hypothetical protein D3C72_543390 [compost metagenome]